MDGTYCANLLHYNAPPYPLMDGFPEGPFFMIDTSNGGGTWTPNGPLNIPLNLYQTQSLTTQIGTAVMSSDYFTLDPTQSTPNFVGGYVRLTTNVDPTKVQWSSIPGNPFNFGNLSTELYFQPYTVWPMDGVPLVNRILADPDLTSIQSNYQMVLWGGNGWDPTLVNSMNPMMMGDFGSTRTTGFDFRAQLTCVGHEIKQCPNCNSPPAVYTLDTSCVAPGKTVQEFSSGTCISLGFDSVFPATCP